MSNAFYGTNHRISLKTGAAPFLMGLLAPQPIPRFGSGTIKFERVIITVDTDLELSKTSVRIGGVQLRTTLLGNILIGTLRFS